MIVKFTQYLRPNGRKRDIYTEVTDELGPQIDQIIVNGFNFTAEVVAETMVVLTISDDRADYEMHVCQNGTEVPETIERMIRAFDLDRALEERKRS